LALQSLRAGAEARQLRRPAYRTCLRLRFGVAAVMATQHAVRMEDERGVAVGAPQRRPASSAMQCRRDTASVEQENRLAAAVDNPAELLQQRRRQRGARPAAEGGDAAP